MSSSSARRILLFWIACLVLAGCQSNTCQDLCVSYYQMGLRCDLFGQDSGQLEASCLLQAEDPQTLKQRADYDTRQCRQDFRYASCREQRDCCKNVCFEALQQEYDAVDGTSESSVDMRRDLCQKYRSLVRSGTAGWCESLQASCFEQQSSCSEP